MVAEVKILIEGYTNADSVAETGEEKTWPTITLIRDGEIVMIVDPGTVDQEDLIKKLENENLSSDDINIVFITHSHIDHYRNIGMFKNAKTLEFLGLWEGNKVEKWNQQFTPNIQILKTSGHDYTSISILVKTNIGIVAICGDVFWRENSPKDDIYAYNRDKLETSRNLILKMADWVIPGHGPIFRAEYKPKSRMEKILNDKNVRLSSNCKKCHKIIYSQKDRCACQEWLCYHCCECEVDCDVCNCKHRR
jgi:glyoxylase-like metal-dependent hydrolase (beta-lactamase superfamily II)